MKFRIVILLSFLITFYSCSSDSGNNPTENYVFDIIQNVNIDTLRKHVDILSGEQNFNYNGTFTTIETRHNLHEGNDIAADYIEMTLRSYGLSVTNQAFDERGRNVIATIPGTEYPNEHYIICAHYDDCGNHFCDADSSSIAPGADDNASGVACVLEAARLLSNYQPKFTLVFALWDEEEIGLLGSLHYAENARSQNMIINGVINLDMISWNGDPDPVAKVIVWDTENVPELGQKSVEINETYSIGLTLEYYYRNGGSDFASFWYYEYPAIGLIEDFDDWNVNYHSVLDLSSNIDWQYYHQMSKLAVGMLADYALN